MANRESEPKGNPFVRYPRSWFKTSESISIAKQLWEENSGMKVIVECDENQIKFVFEEKEPGRTLDINIIPNNFIFDA